MTAEKMYLLVEFPVSDAAPLRAQQLAHRKWMLPLVRSHGGDVRMALRSDQLHGFGLDIDPPIHYYKVSEMDTRALIKEYEHLKRESLERIRDNKPWNWGATLSIMEEHLIARGESVPEVTLAK